MVHYTVHKEYKCWNCIATQRKSKRVKAMKTKALILDSECIWKCAWLNRTHSPVMHHFIPNALDLLVRLCLSMKLANSSSLVVCAYVYSPFDELMDQWTDQWNLPFYPLNAVVNSNNRNLFALILVHTVAQSLSFSLSFTWSIIHSFCLFLFFFRLQLWMCVHLILKCTSAVHKHTHTHRHRHRHTFSCSFD